MSLMFCLFLRRYRAAARRRILDAHGTRYKREKEQILSLLTNTTHYHGTGAYQYAFAKNKYLSRNPEGIRYVLRDILRSGLRPRRDLFNDTFETGEKHSISLTKDRIYARTYAELFMEEDAKLAYAYGPRLLWNLVIFFKTMLGWLEHNKYFLVRSKEHKRKGVLARKRYKVMLRGWARAFRADGKYEGKNYLITLSEGRSDIKGNFGIVIGVGKDMAELPIRYPAISEYETRVRGPIPPTAFTHIQAPLGRVDVVKQELKKYGLDIPVIPIEFVELMNFEASYRSGAS